MSPRAHLNAGKTGRPDRDRSVDGGFLFAGCAIPSLRLHRERPRPRRESLTHKSGSSLWILWTDWSHSWMDVAVPAQLTHDGVRWAGLTHGSSDATEWWLSYLRRVDRLGSLTRGAARRAVMS